MNRFEKVVAVITLQCEQIRGISSISQVPREEKLRIAAAVGKFAAQITDGKTATPAPKDDENRRALKALGYLH